MNIGRTTLGITGICALGVASGLSNAEMANFADPAILSPFSNAQVDVIWVNSDAGYTGELNWLSHQSADPFKLWDNHSAITGQSSTLLRLYDQGERVDFSYEIIAGRYDHFSTANFNDWSQFSIDSSNPLDVLVGVEDIRYPRGDMDHNDAVFRVVFTQRVVPTPGSLALLGGGCLAIFGRRRR